MAIRKTWMAAAAALLAAGLVMTGCPNGNDHDDGLGDPGVGGLPDLDTTVDQTEGTDILLAPGQNMTATDVGNMGDYDGNPSDGVESWKVKAGNLSFKFDTDESQPLEPISVFLEDKFNDDGSGDKWKVTVTVNGRNVSTPEGFGWDDYWISRSKSKMDGQIEKGSYIEYVYVDDDVTLSRGGVKDSGSDEYYSWDYTYKAFTLELKKGWNLVQSDYAANLTSNSNIVTVAFKIANKDVPWTVDKDDGYRSKGIFGKKR